MTTTQRHKITLGGSVAGSSNAPLVGWRADLRLARDYERLATMLAGMHVFAFSCLMLRQWFSTSGP